MSFISVEKKDSGICYLTLNRPEIHNAFDEVLINEFKKLNDGNLIKNYVYNNEDYFFSILKMILLPSSL